MKSQLLFLIGFIFSTNIYAQEYSSWKWLHPRPQGNTLEWVKVWDENNWYALGYNGTFIKTTDGGSTFIYQSAGHYDTASASCQLIEDAWFFDMNTGIVVGGAGGYISKTTDGGTVTQRKYQLMSLFH